MTTTVNGTITFSPLRTNDGKTDIENSLVLAKQLLEEFAAKDDPLTQKIGEAGLKVWNEPKYSGLRSISVTTLARMALNALGMSPDDKACKDAALRIRAVFSGQPDKFLFLRVGKNKGIHYRSRYTPEELSAILPTK